MSSRTEEWLQGASCWWGGSFTEQTSCSQFSWAGAGDHQPICRWSLQNIRYFSSSMQHLSDLLLYKAYAVYISRVRVCFKSIPGLAERANHWVNWILEKRWWFTVDLHRDFKVCTITTLYQYARKARKTKVLRTFFWGVTVRKPTSGHPAAG